MTSPTEHRLRKNPQVVSRELVNGESVLLHLGSGSYHGLNCTGSLIWELIDGERMPAELCTELRERLPDAPPDLDEVVVTFLAGLRERELIVE